MKIPNALYCQLISDRSVPIAYIRQLLRLLEPYSMPSQTMAYIVVDNLDQALFHLERHVPAELMDMYPEGLLQSDDQTGRAYAVNTRGFFIADIYRYFCTLIDYDIKILEFQLCGEVTDE